MMLAGQQITQDEIREQAERLVEAERAEYCQDEPEPGAGQDEQSAPGAGRFGSQFVLKCLGMNQIGDAEIFKRLHRCLFLYDHAAGQWFKWAGHYWQQDKMESVVAAMQAVCRVYEIELQRVSWRVNQARGKKDE